MNTSTRKIGYPFSPPSSVGFIHNPARIAGSPVFKGGKPPETLKISAEYAKLKRQDALYGNMAKCFLGTMLSPFLAPHKMISLPDIVSDGFQLLRPTQRNAYCRARAEFNVTGKLKALHPYLPTRQRLAADQDESGIQQYDQLIQQMLQKVEFFESGTQAFQKYQNQSRQAMWRAEAQREKGQGKVVDARNSSKLIPMHDQSMKYLIAGQIAELLYRHPEYAQGALNREGRPLRFVVAHDVADAGQLGFYTGLDHTIYLNAPCMYLVQKRSFMAQHEFVHAMSRGKDVEHDMLPLMSADQKKRYEDSRQRVQQILKQQFGSWLGRLKFWLTGKNQAQVLNHGFMKNQEFLAVSLDAFMRYPEKLCKTEPGKALYQLYQEMFSIDPKKAS